MPDTADRARASRGFDPPARGRSGGAGRCRTVRARRRRSTLCFLGWWVARRLGAARSPALVDPGLSSPFPYLLLAAVLVLGPGRLAGALRRREIVIGLLALVWVFNMVGVGSPGRLAAVSFGIADHGAASTLSGGVRAGSPTRWRSDSLSGSSTVVGPLPARFPRPGRGSPTFSFRRTRIPSSPATDGHPPLGLPLRFTHEFDRVQPDRRDAAHPARQRLMAAESTSQRSQSCWSPHGP